MLVKYNARSPTNKDNGITKPFPFNLMFKTTIGPEGNSVGFLRPETAQGLFVNFRYVLSSFHVLLLLLPPPPLLLLLPLRSASKNTLPTQWD